MQQYLLREFRTNQYITYYAFTISPHSRLQEQGVLADSVTDLMKICKNVISCRYIFETSDLGKVHIHGLLASKSRCKFVKLRKHPLVQYYFKVYDGNRKWLNYMEKGQPDHCYTNYYNEFHQLQAPKHTLTWFGFVEDSDSE